MTCYGPLLSLALCAVLADALPSAAHLGDRLFPIACLSPETLANIELDGHVEDWVDALGEPALTPLDFYLQSHPSLNSYHQYDPSNLDFRIWLAWSPPGRFFVAGEFADDVYRNEDHAVFYFSDSAALMVDGDHSGGRYQFFGSHGPGETRELDPRANQQAQFYEVISRVAEGPQVSLPFISATTRYWPVSLPYAFGSGRVAGENPTIWTVEFFATCFDELNVLDDPEVSVISELAPGKVIGFDFAVTDWDRNETKNARFFLSPQAPENYEGEGADYFFDGLLLGPQGEPGDSAVQSVSWGRIKASLGVSFPPIGSMPGMK